MQRVCTSLLVRADHSSVSTTVLRAHAVRNDREILNGLKRRVNIDAPFAEVIVVVASIQ